ncbi:MAG: alpha/beta hydrolase, partial [Pseudomonadota bacterium]
MNGKATGMLAVWLVAAALTASTPVMGSTDAPRFLPGETTDFVFESSGLTLSGVFDAPIHKAQALIVLVHGYGPTDIRQWNTFAALRRQFNDIGIATAVWDKPGQGRSGGEFDINQSVYSSAEEVLAAAQYLREQNAPGSDRIGLWGVSRAGWIAPIALSRDSAIDFWISVGGTTAEDNFGHLLLSNWPYEGGTHADSKRLAAEWRRGCELLRTGGSYDDFLTATQTLRANAYIVERRGAWRTREAFESQQQVCVEGACPSMDNDLCSY